MKYHRLEKYILISLVVLITAHLIFKIYSDRKLKNDNIGSVSFVLFLWDKPQNCYYQTRQGYSFVLNNCQDLQIGKHYTIIGTMNTNADNVFLSQKRLIIGDIYEVDNDNVSRFDFLLSSFGLFMDLLFHWRVSLMGTVSPYLSSENSTLPLTLTLGGKATTLEADFRDQVRQIGVAHLLAVSGFHLGIIMGIILLFVKRFSRTTLTIVVILILIWYCLLTGSGASIVRATIMLILSLIYRYIFYKQFSALFGLCLSFLLMMLTNTFYLSDVGFLLSFASMTGILLLGRFDRQAVDLRHYHHDQILQGSGQKADSHTRTKFRSWCKSFKGAILTSLVAQLFTLPICIYFFAYVCLVGIPAGLVLTPLLAPLMTLTIVMYAVSFFRTVFPFLSDLFMFALGATIGKITTLFSSLVSYFDSLPVTTVDFSNTLDLKWLLLYYLSIVFLLWPIYRRKFKRCYVV